MGSDGNANTLRKALAKLAQLSYTGIDYWKKETLSSLRLWIEAFAEEEGDD